MSALAKENQEFLPEELSAMKNIDFNNGSCIHKELLKDTESTQSFQTKINLNWNGNELKWVKIMFFHN